jgi:ABC-2 type transport system permease protein
MYRADKMRFYLSLLATSIRASIALRGAFLLEFTLLIANNFIFMSMWWIFFTKFRAIGDWQLQDIIALFAIGGGAYGLMQVCFGGTKQLTKMIQSGDLDTYLTQPKNVLLQIAGSKSATKGWGHLMTTLILIVLGGLTEPKTLALILLSMCTGCLIFASIRIIAHSLAFWLGPVEA